MSLPALGGVTVCVAMTQRAFHYCQRRFGKWEPVLTWDELKAWGDAAAGLAPDRKAAVLREGMDYFTARQAQRS